MFHRKHVPKIEPQICSSSSISCLNDISPPCRPSQKPGINLVSFPVPQTSHLVTKSNQLYPPNSSFSPLPHSQNWLSPCLHPLLPCFLQLLSHWPLYFGSYSFLCCMLHTLCPPHNHQSGSYKSKKPHHVSPLLTTMHTVHYTTLAGASSFTGPVCVNGALRVLQCATCTTVQQPCAIAPLTTLQWLPSGQ